MKNYDKLFMTIEAEYYFRTLIIIYSMILEVAQIFTRNVYSHV